MALPPPSEKYDASSFVFERVTLIGMGLIGSSIARAIRTYKLARHICVIDTNTDVRLKVAALNLADTITDDFSVAVQDADCIILCVPVRASGFVAEQIAPFLKKNAIVTDVGSVKTSVIRDVSPHLPAHVHFVPAHPIAGTEHSGPEAGKASLFANRWCILTPLETAKTSDDSLRKIRVLWEGMGSIVEEMTPEHHDLVLAITSHIPHLIAYNIVGTAADLEHVTRSEIIKFSAGGFRDFTRIASSDPIMWRDIFLSNREAVLEVLSRFNEDLSALSKAIRAEDGDSLQEFFARSRAVRRGTNLYQIISNLKFKKLFYAPI
jgi:cyclohexadieny/prephenate dehydrogenase